MLTDEEFINIIKLTPLISIDFIVKNKRNEILLGKRVNSPARGYYFVPGGRILKDETINDAFLRLSLTELGISIPKDLWNFHGVYEHFYEYNKYNKLFSTHYIVLAYETILTDKINFPTNQHSKYKWVLESLVGKDERIHNYTKNYFPA